jgi:hypothetical protein
MREVTSRFSVCAAGSILLLGALTASAFLDPKEKAWINARRNFWAFQNPQRPDVPELRSQWIRNPVDAFVLEQMQTAKIKPAPELDRARLLRRVALDLTGLPPTPGELDLFLADKSPDAYEKVVDRLLASPQYGERWAQRWLDVVRYADTNGYELDLERPQAWRYRDYVVKAFNTDKPYDRFIKEQIAGDELFPGDKEALVATGFHRAGPIHLVGGNQDEEMNRQEVLTEMTGAVGSAFLGLTVGCARCHNHKFDPILQSDYYRLQAVLAATDLKDVDIATPEEKASFDAAKAAYDAQAKPIEEQIKQIEAPYKEKLRAAKREKLEPQYLAALAIPEAQRDKEQKRLAKEGEDQINPPWDEVLATLSPEDRARRTALRQQLHKVELSTPDPAPAAYAVANMEKAPETHILKVGDYKHKLGEVDPGFLSIITPDADVPKNPQGRRTALANWLASPDHPLTTRVMVNRIWQFRMGTGLVSTPNDFGAMGGRPSNAKLLDWLATEFVAEGWHVKKIDRLIMTSSAYRQEATLRRRLEAEEIRDSILAASGLLNPRMGGKPVRVPIEKEVYDLIFTEYEADNLWPLDPDKQEQYRRSLYLLNKRTVRLPMMANFDQPDAMTSCAMRPSSTHALQALTLMNSDFMTEQSHAFAARLTRECGTKDEGCQIRRAYKLTLARSPRPAEMTQAHEFLAKDAKPNSLPLFCLALLNRNDFVYLP